MGDAFSLSAKRFLPLSPQERVALVERNLPSHCLAKAQPDRQYLCIDAMLPMADVFVTLPPGVQSDLLTSFRPWLRNNFFKLMVPKESEEQLASLILQFPPQQAPDLLARIGDPLRARVLSCLGEKGEAGEAVINAWNRRGNIPRWEAEHTDKEWVVRQLDNPMLLQTCESFGGLDEYYCVEATRRKKESARVGNGITLPEKESSYKDIQISSRRDEKNWVMTGKFYDGVVKQWREFRYVAKTKTFLQELWIGEKLYFPSRAQDRIFHDLSAK